MLGYSPSGLAQDERKFVLFRNLLEEHNRAYQSAHRHGILARAWKNKNSPSVNRWTGNVDAIFTAPTKHRLISDNVPRTGSWGLWLLIRHHLPSYPNLTPPRRSPNRIDFYSLSDIKQPKGSPKAPPLPKPILQHGIWSALSPNTKKAVSLDTPFTSLFHACLDNGTSPSTSKHALMAPTHKMGTQHLPTNYRPVSPAKSSGEFSNNASFLIDNETSFIPRLPVLLLSQQNLWWRTYFACTIQ